MDTPIKRGEALYRLSQGDRKFWTSLRCMLQGIVIRSQDYYLHQAKRTLSNLSQLFQEDTESRAGDEKAKRAHESKYRWEEENRHLDEQYMRPDDARHRRKSGSTRSGIHSRPSGLHSGSHSFAADPLNARMYSSFTEFSSYQGPYQFFRAPIEKCHVLGCSNHDINDINCQSRCSDCQKLVSASQIIVINSRY